VLVVSTNNSKEKAVEEAVEKMKAALNTKLGKLKNK
jgi:hypothetical protein